MNVWFNVSTNCIMLKIKKTKQERLLKKNLYTTIYFIYGVITWGSNKH